MCHMTFSPHHGRGRWARSRNGLVWGSIQVSYVNYNNREESVRWTRTFENSIEHTEKWGVAEEDGQPWRCDVERVVTSVMSWPLIPCCDVAVMSSRWSCRDVSHVVTLVMLSRLPCCDVCHFMTSVTLWRFSCCDVVDHVVTLGVLRWSTTPNTSVLISLFILSSYGVQRQPPYTHRRTISSQAIIYTEAENDIMSHIQLYTTVDTMDNRHSIHKIGPHGIDWYVCIFTTVLYSELYYDTIRVNIPSGSGQ